MWRETRRKSPASARTRVSRTMKLEYYSLGLVFIMITHAPHVYMAVYQTYHCCPSHNKTYSADSGDCQNGKWIKIPSLSREGAWPYCKSLKKCFAGIPSASFPCKISNSEDYSCSNQTAEYKVCRGILTSIAACRK